MVTQHQQTKRKRQRPGEEDAPFSGTNAGCDTCCGFLQAQQKGAWPFDAVAHGAIEKPGADDRDPDATGGLSAAKRLTLGNKPSLAGRIGQ